MGATDLDELADGLAAVGVPSILKTCTQGYDGKGQISIDMDNSLAAVWEQIGTEDAILEKRVQFTKEISVIVARGSDGTVASFPIAENSHEDGILRKSVAPAEILTAVARKAQAAAEAMAVKLNLIGLLAVEMFVTEENEVLINEMAPRPHNSGHWTIEGCATSQFEQLVRAVCDLPLGPVKPPSSGARCGT